MLGISVLAVVNVVYFCRRESVEWFAYSSEKTKNLYHESVGNDH
jgi:hypothetical protein